MSSLSGSRMEECSPGGCYMELCMQMAIIFVGKQFLLSFVEYHLPRLWKLYNSFKVSGEAPVCARDLFLKRELVLTGIFDTFSLYFGMGMRHCIVC